MLAAYRQHVAERAALGIPPLPLSAQQTGELIEHLQKTGRLKPCFYMPALVDARNTLASKGGER